MTPTLRKTWVECFYWECQDITHRHKTQEIATVCMEASKRLVHKQPKSVRRTRWLEAATAALHGAAWKDVASLISVSVGRAQTIVENVLRISARRSEVSYPGIKQAKLEREAWLAHVELTADSWGIPLPSWPITHEVPKISDDALQTLAPVLEWPRKGIQ